MWRNGSGHRAVRSSGPRSHASGSDQGKKNSKSAAAALDIVAASKSAVEAEEKEAERRLLQKQREQREAELLQGTIGKVLAIASPAPPAAATISAESPEEIAAKKKRQLQILMTMSELLQADDKFAELSAEEQRARAVKHLEEKQQQSAEGAPIDK